jgi:2-polyprenyl-6-hydroxyphenyl methylase/3-demethylubiquinone-9 3-methyltransferase
VINVQYLIEMSTSSDQPPDKGPGKANEAARTSVDAAEIAGFEAMAAEWWDPDGKFRPLHRLNPTRIAFIRDHVAAHYKRPASRSGPGPGPFDGLTLLDIGTGGGLVAEPMARLGAAVTGIDPSDKNTAIARTHSEAFGLDISYRATTAEQMAADGEQFDIVLALEVVEHVADIGVFLEATSRLVRPGGMLIASTINRTKRAYALAIIGVEYVMNWLPRGTHDWDKFVTPGELTAALEDRGMQMCAVAGLTYNPLTRAWRISGDTGVNYIIAATKDA